MSSDLMTGRVNATTFVIFGASGDLTQRKLIPALFSLRAKGRLPTDFRVLGFATRPWSAEEFRRNLEEGLKRYHGQTSLPESWVEFSRHLHYLPGNFADSNDFSRLAQELASLEGGPANRIFYFAAPPRYYADIVRGLGEHQLLSESPGWRRIVIEKPFGSDLASAHDLNRALYDVAREDQIYRIDHYLGKETVQNVLVFRFANSIFEPIWNRNYVDHVQITVAEELGVEHRAKYYDGVGVVRDMFQNHLLQLLTLVAMEPPSSFTADALRNEKVKVLRAVRPIAPRDTQLNSVRGQYLGYRQEPGVDPNSETATFGALRLYVDNWRWQGVPFYLRSGKELREKASEVLIQFNCPPHVMFPTGADTEITPNLLSLCLQPDEGIHLRFEVKVPDNQAEMRSMEMEFHYRDAFGGMAIPQAYERLLLDVMQGDASLFVRGDQIELAWGIVDPIQAGWEGEQAPALSMYERGSWGPAAADALMARDGRAWIMGCGGHSPSGPVRVHGSKTLSPRDRPSPRETDLSSAASNCRA
ncbi:MAG: glucose-6-phosphate dehydrogenase [Anaerolineales bacterium]|jgi:glucose-6-phosphate 1-dehydrogenase